MKISNMTSSRGNLVPNQFYVSGVAAGIYNQEGVHIPSGDMFQSYTSIIAFIDHTGKIWLDKYKWNYSRTTTKYLNQFLGDNARELVKKGKVEFVSFN